MYLSLTLLLESGIIVFHVISGELAKKARLEVLLDDGYWPVFTTAKTPGRRAGWRHVGEGFLKELDFGRVWFRLNESDDLDKEDVFAEWKGDAKPFLEQALVRTPVFVVWENVDLCRQDGPSKFRLLDQDERCMGTIEVEARYVPVPVKLEARESVNSQYRYLYSPTYVTDKKIRSRSAACQFD